MSKPNADAMPHVVLVMGVSGCGKSTVGTLLAQKLGWEFCDGDWLHPKSNVEKMHAGTPLTDDDRLPWLKAIAGWIDDKRRQGSHGVVTCSALKRRYRDILIGPRADVRLVFLRGSEELISGRLGRRNGHFMPTSLLHSQFEALEEPTPDERPIIAPIEPAPEAIAADVLKKLER